MENKSTETKVQPTLQERAMIFMQYLGQEIYAKSNNQHHPTKETLRLFGVDCHSDSEVRINRVPYHHFLHHGWNIMECSLLVKSLGEISDEDKSIIVAHRYGENWEKEWENTDSDVHFSSARIVEMILTRKPSVHLVTIDYLRSKGYALPWEKWSVEELVEFGIFKIISDGK